MRRISPAASRRRIRRRQLDGAKPTYESPLYSSTGIREGTEVITVPAGKTIKWFSVDSAGNVEKNYKPDGSGSNHSTTTVKAPR